jgi:copper chaperone CopZ
MKTLQFKTNIKCSGCVATVTPFLNDSIGKDNWQIDLASPERLLTVRSETTTGQQVIDTLKEAGFTSEVVN